MIGVGLLNEMLVLLGGLGIWWLVGIVYSVVDNKFWIFLIYNFYSELNQCSCLRLQLFRYIFRLGLRTKKHHK